MNENQFVMFSGGVGANALNSVAFRALTSLIGQGFQSGTAKSEQFNALMRQVSTVASMVGQIVADYSGSDAVDDGNVAVLEARFLAALKVVLQPLGVYFLTDTSVTANKIVATASPAPSSLSLVRLAVVKKNGLANTGAMQINLFGLGDVALNDQNGASMAANSAQAGSFLLVAANGNSEMRAVGGISAVTNVSELTANSGKSTAVLLSGAVDVDMTHDTTHNATPAGTDIVIRQNSDKTILNMTITEMIAWLNSTLDFLTDVPPNGPGSDVGQFVFQTLTTGIGDGPEHYITRGVTTATGAQLQGGVVPGLPTGNNYPVNAAPAGWTYPMSTIDGVLSGVWKYRGCLITQSVTISWQWLLIWEKVSA